MIPTIDIDGRIENLEVLMRDIQKFLREEFQGEFQKPQTLIKYYWEASRKAEQLIQTVLGENSRFPIDIELLAKKLGAQVEIEDLNEFLGWKSMNRKIGQILIEDNFFTKRKMKTIFVDKAAPLSSKRYAIAHELAHYIMHYDDEDFYEDYCIMPMCPANIEEVVADIFAIFLLIPVRHFFVEFLEYVKRKIEEGRTPVTTESWIRHLAERAMIPDYYVAYGYQQLRYVAYWIYQAWNDENNMLRMSRDPNVMTDEDKELVRMETEGYYTKEMSELLFE